MRARRTLLLTCLSITAAECRPQSLYFPPNIGGTWETLDPSTLGWCPDRIEQLYEFLGSRNTKAFIVLKDGRIVLEHYFGTFTQDSLWFWASAGKTLTSTLVGIAQEEGYLDIDSTTSTYLGSGWTSAPADKESLITVRNQLSMTSGLDDGVVDNYCTDTPCLQYLADAGTRWAYHNAPYTLLDQVIANATSQSFPSYFNSRIRDPIGMDGFWFASGYNNVYASKARSMARYGLLALNQMVWDTDTILHDAAYFNAATTTSQNLNNSYGYLWWINGESSFMVPGLQFVLPGSLMPAAPDDMFSGLGKYDQILNVVPGQGLVLVRLGDQAYTDNLVPITFNDEIWELMEQLPCSTATTRIVNEGPFSISPNPASDRVSITLPSGSGTATVSILDQSGRCVLREGLGHEVDVSQLPIGSYIMRIERVTNVWTAPLLKR